MMTEAMLLDQTIGERFLATLTGRDFDRLESYFHPNIRFRALVPPGIREGANAQETAAWLRRWFDNADEFQTLASSSDVVADRLHITYRFRLRKGIEWQLIEQQAYCIVNEGRIETMNLLCSGFRPDPDYQRSADRCLVEPATAQTVFGADAFYDAGARGCAEGPLDDIAGLMGSMSTGQTLEIHATDPSILRDLPAWCRLVGHELVKHENDHYLIRHK